MLRKTNLAVWRAWRSWKLSLHSSTVCASSGPGLSDRSEELSSVSSEKPPPHTPVMLKEVLHYLDIQPGQVRVHLCYVCKLSERKSVSLNVLFHKSNISSEEVTAVLKYSNKSNSVILLHHYCQSNVFTEVFPHCKAPRTVGKSDVCLN